MKLLLKLVSVAISAFLFCSTGFAQGQKPLTKLRIGVTPIYTTLPVWVGKEQGFFRDEGIDLEILPTAGGATAIPAMEGGSLDLVYTDVSTIFRAVDQGLKIRIVAPACTVSLDPSKDGSRLLVAKDSPMRKVSDAAGKRVAVNLLRNIVHLYVLAGLDHAGVAPGTYMVVEIPFSQMPDALLNGHVDMIYAVDPFSTIMVKADKVKDFGSATYAVHPNLRIASYVASQRMINQNPELVRRFQRAYFRAAEYVMQNRAMHGEWQVKYFRLKPELKDQVGTDGLFEDADMGAPYVASLVKTKNLMLKYKFLNTDLDPEKLIFR